MQIGFTTNIDVIRPIVHALQWTSPHIPRKSEMVVFHFAKWMEDGNMSGSRRFEFQLEVESVTWDHAANVVSIYLGIPSCPRRGIGEWSEWFKNHFANGRVITKFPDAGI